MSSCHQANKICIKTPREWNILKLYNPCACTPPIEWYNGMVWYDKNTVIQIRTSTGTNVWFVWNL